MVNGMLGTVIFYKTLCIIKLINVLSFIDNVSFPQYACLKYD